MARLVVHAGMPKAGSSAIQQLLFDHATELAEHGVVTAVAEAVDAGGVDFRITTERANNSVEIVLGLRDQGRRTATLAAVEDGLRGLLADDVTVVVTSEALAQPFWQGDTEFLGLLNAIAEDNRVSAAYYVRPQHTALEAAWRQWGYRSGWAPGRYMEDRARMMDYLDTFELVTDAAPNVDFIVRPFRRDLLFEGDVVLDFLTVVLELPHLDLAPVWANRGLPLDLVNLLALDPDSALWEDEHDNVRLAALKAALTDVEVPLTDELQASKAALQQVCHDRFEPSNRRLALRVGWGDVELVPSSGVRGGWTLEDFDELWRPVADSSAVHWLHASLVEMVRGHGALAELRRELEATRRRLITSEEERESAAAARQEAQERYERLLDRKAVRAALSLARLVRPLVRREATS